MFWTIVWAYVVGRIIFAVLDGAVGAVALHLSKGTFMDEHMRKKRPR